MNCRVLKILIFVTGCALIVLFVQLYKFQKEEEDTALHPLDNQLQVRDEFTENTIPYFEFFNQYGQKISQKDFENRIYIADFFFTSCPTICPAMAGNKAQIQQAFRSDPRVLILSHSIDTDSDSIPRLKEYAEQVGALKNKWHLVTGERNDIYGIARQYYVTAQQSDFDNETYIHDGNFILIDGEKHIRGIYDGTDLASTHILIRDIKGLLTE